MTNQVRSILAFFPELMRNLCLGSNVNRQGQQAIIAPLIPRIDILTKLSCIMHRQPKRFGLRRRVRLRWAVCFRTALIPIESELPVVKHTNEPLFSLLRVYK